MFSREEFIRRASSIIRNTVTMLLGIALCQAYIPIKHLIMKEPYSLEAFWATLDFGHYFPIVLVVSFVISRRRSGSKERKRR